MSRGEIYDGQRTEVRCIFHPTLFNQSIPVEEQLRVLSENPAGEPLPAAARAQLDMHLKQLIARYARLVAPERQRITDNEKHIDE
jgi:type VI secretion system protein VasL